MDVERCKPNVRPSTALRSAQDEEILSLGPQQSHPLHAAAAASMCESRAQSAV
jgi:hypothetical protein